MSKAKRVLAAAAMVGALCAIGAVKKATGAETAICYQCLDNWDPNTGYWTHFDFFSLFNKTHQDNKHGDEAVGDCSQHTAYR
jgi:hypothetical protein